MDNNLIKLIEEQIVILSQTEDEKEKKLIRNSIFEKMYPDIDNWLKSHLKKSAFLESSERLSLCWDCFEYCLKYYVPERKIPLPNHFNSYSRFFLLCWLEEKRKRNENKSNYEGDEHLDYLNIYYEQIDELKKFKETLPTDYKPIFDDALLSMSGRPSDKIPYTKSKSYSYYKYCEAKKVFKLVIDFLLRR